VKLKFCRYFVPG